MRINIICIMISNVFDLLGPYQPAGLNNYLFYSVVYNFFPAVWAESSDGYVRA